MAMLVRPQIEILSDTEKTLAEIRSELGHPPVLELRMVQEVGA